MAKKILGNKVVEVWLNQSQHYGVNCSNGNLYFVDDTIYSYGEHFPIAKIRTAPTGEEVIFMTTRTNSATTNSHVWFVKSALRYQSRRVVYCSDVSETFGQHNLQDFECEMRKAAIKHDKARKPALYVGNVLSEARKAREYCEVMCLSVPTWALLPESIEAGKPLTAALKIFQNDSHAHRM